MMRSLLLFFAVLAGSSLLAVSSAQAFGDGARIDGLEQRLNEMEGRLFTDQKTGGAGVLSDMESRLQQMEEEMRRLTGELEETTHKLTQAQQAMQRMSDDTAMRLQDLEAAKPVASAAGALPKVVPHAAGGRSAVAAPVQAEVEREPVAQEEGATSETAAEPVAGEMAELPTQDEGAVDASPASAVEKTDAVRTLYDESYALMSSADYAAAEKSFASLAKKYPSNPLAGNAYYWMGETQMAQGRPNDAVVSFSTGYKKFPQGVKAPAQLYKMGVAFKKIGKPAFAKGAWEKLVKAYPDAPEAAKAQRELGKLVKG